MRTSTGVGAAADVTRNGLPFHIIDATHFEANEGGFTPSKRRTPRRRRVRGFAERVGLLRSAAPSRLSIPLVAVVSARLWAGPFCSSRRPSRSASHESGRELETRAGCVGRLAAHFAPRGGNQHCVPRSLLLHFACYAFFAFYSACGRLFCRRRGEVWLWSALFWFLRLSGAKPDI